LESGESRPVLSGLLPEPLASDIQNVVTTSVASNEGALTPMVARTLPASGALDNQVRSSGQPKTVYSFVSKNELEHGSISWRHALVERA
jgi:hypothetical protein